MTKKEHQRDVKLIRKTIQEGIDLVRNAEVRGQKAEKAETGLPATI